ncbi:hypothetical protein GSU68_15905 [Rathayibacter sp. VKM Ac-2759]|uniref:hypothetical protein n=1 Tax=Rathayibacter sp. VKM Ac-2759 TaxID=2609252 RepID=UPI00131738FE|nr:hypothetical protein [Rathayibacter sp. VKM Ac-2759]QHC67901.1 hypothetical protein GSU68_15905 [Rathayibacter sp. VKM Ac-2759]
MKTMFHTGGSLRLDDATAESVLRYSLVLAARGEMGAVTLDDVAYPEGRAQVVLVVGLGVPLSLAGTRSPEGILDRSDTGADIDRRVETLIAPRNIVAETGVDWRADSVFDIDLV